MPSVDGTSEIWGTWIPYGETTIVADISAQMYIQDQLIRQDLTYTLSLTDDGLEGDGIVSLCFDLDCTGGTQVITGVRVGKTDSL